MDLILPLYNKSGRRVVPPQRSHTVGYLPERHHAVGIVLEERTPGGHANKQTPSPEGKTPTHIEAKDEGIRVTEIPSTKCYLAEPPQEFDEPGQELGRDAQVWKTYVREADTVDAERVEGWRQTSDVILIFAALFSAISTAFVIESYKGLKPDSADVSVEILRAISRNLVAIANQSQPIETPGAGPEETSEFAPSWSSVCVNLLWFLSLSISVLVSLVAMLAKEWCFQFMSGRTGSPVAQARRRQQRWDGLDKWKMEEVLTFLPSLIHLALLLFAIGLSIFLWDINLVVAIPVTLVTGFGIMVYIACTVVPFIDTYCPYGTTLSRMYQQLFGIKLQSSQDDPEPDTVTNRAIEWMFNHCETPRAVEVAFQSAAGFTDKFDWSRIEKYEAWSAMCRRFLNAQLYGSLPNPALSRWTVSLLRWGKYRHLKYYKYYEQPTDNQTLGAMIWAIQALIDRLCAKELDRQETSTSSKVTDIQELLSHTAHHCVEGVSQKQRQNTRNGKPEEANLPSEYDDELCDLQPIEQVTAHLERYFNADDNGLFPLATFEALSTSFTLLLCCSLMPCTPATAVKYLLRLLQTPRGQQSVEIKLAMVAFAFSRHDFPGWSQPTEGNVYLRTQRALEVYHHYQKVKLIDGSTDDVVYIGRLMLFSAAQVYGLEDDHIRAIERRGWGFWNPSRLSVYTFPSDVDLYQHLFKSLTQGCSRAIQVTPKSPLLAETHSKYLSRAWSSARDSERTKLMTAELYALVSDEFSSQWIDKSFILALSPLPQLSPTLDTHLHARRIIPQLLRMAVDSSDLELQTISVAQLWVLIRISTSTDQDQSKIHAELEQQRLAPDGAWKEYQDLKEVGDMLRDRIFDLLRPGDSVYLGIEIYGNRVMECMLEADGCLSSDPRMVAVNSYFKRREVPQELRGLSSFVVYPDGGDE